MSHPERVFSRAELIRYVWPSSSCVEERTVDVHIRHLRAALESAGHRDRIQTVRGMGYVMAKTLVIDSEEGTRVPFLRGILTRSLQEVGLEFEQAYDLATSLRDDLSGQSRIESTELRELVAGRLRKSHGDIARRYLSGTEASDVVMVSGDGDARLAPFSAETHRKSLEFCDMTDSEARDFSHAIGRHLVARISRQVARPDRGE